MFCSVYSMVFVKGADLLLKVLHMQRILLAMILDILPRCSYIAQHILKMYYGHPHSTSYTAHEVLDVSMARQLQCCTLLHTYAMRMAQLL